MNHLIKCFSAEFVLVNESLKNRLKSIYCADKHDGEANLPLCSFQSPLKIILRVWRLAQFKIFFKWFMWVFTQQFPSSLQAWTRYSALVWNNSLSLLNTLSAFYNGKISTIRIHIAIQNTQTLKILRALKKEWMISLLGITQHRNKNALTLFKEKNKWSYTCTYKHNSSILRQL